MVTEFKNSRGSFLFINTPHRSCDHLIENNNFIFSYDYSDHDDIINIPLGKWKNPLNVRDLKQNDIENILESYIDKGGYEFWDGIDHYEYNSLDAWEVFLKHMKIYYENPLGNIEPIREDFENWKDWVSVCADWNKAQIRCGKWYILFEQS